jgi:hypothetical protein
MKKQRPAERFYFRPTVELLEERNKVSTILGFPADSLGD